MWESYYYHTLFIVVLLSVLILLRPTNRSLLVPSPDNKFTWIIILGIVYMLAYTPIPMGTGADREYYVRSFIAIQEGYKPIDISDQLFYYWQNITGKIMDYKQWLIVTAFLYVCNYFVVAKRITTRYTFVMMLMFITAFSFRSYGVNTMRAGVAATFILLGITSIRSLWQYLFLWIGVMFHFSMIIPAIAFVITKFYDKTRLFFALWLLAVPISAVAGGFFEQIFSAFGDVDNRAMEYLIGDSENSYQTGFRLDFILYSCIPILLGYYYIYKQGFNDKRYKQLYNTYILANIFWVLVIRASYSDRFAYLSWILYPILLIYPLLQQRLLPKQNEKIALILLLQEVFTYFMFLKG